MLTIRTNRIFPIILAMLSVIATAVAQEKRITPVDIDEGKPQTPVLHYYDKHGNPLKEPVLFLSDLDTVKKVNPGPVYPLLGNMEIGLNFFDAAMLFTGQKHAGLDLSLRIPLHNWFIPTLEAGVGFADNNPEDGNYHYIGKPSPYFRLGLDYNFLYKSDPAYQVFVGLRAGFSPFRYDIRDISISSSYWDETETIDINGQHATSFFGQVLAGLKVKIGGPVSMGWTVRYGFRFHTSKPSQSDPWYIPGYGTSPLSATFSIFFNIPLKRNKAADASVSDSD